MINNFSQWALSNRSSHTRFELFFLLSKKDRNKTGLHRFKPNSRIFLCDEQSHPCHLLKRQDKMNRHRGHKRKCRFDR